MFNLQPNANHLKKAILFSFILIIFLQGCFLYKEVQIRNIRNVELVKFENNALIIEADVDVDNPNFYDIEVVGSELNIFLNDDLLGNATIINELTVNKKTKEAKHLEIRTVYKGKMSTSLRGIFGLALGKEMTIKIDGVVKGKAMGFTREYPLILEEKITL